MAHPALVLLVVAIVAYGLLLPLMGFYWDEIPMSWIRYELGPEAMTRYFSTNRPIWGLLYQFTTHVLPHVPIYWEIFALVLRWLSAFIVWAIAAQMWPGSRDFAMITGLAFLLYPGFNQQWTSYLYSHFFIVLCFLLLSFLCSIWAVRHRERRVPLTAAGMVLSGLNLWMMEYFFVLELLRPALIWRTVSLRHPTESARQRFRRTTMGWTPYLAVFLANLLWRMFVFNNQIYQPTLLSAAKTDPVGAAVEIVRAVAVQFYRTTFVAWAQVFHFPVAAREGPRTLVFYGAVVLIVGAVVMLYFHVTRLAEEGNSRREWWPLGIGGLAMLGAAGPFLLTGLEVTTAYPANRFTLPFMLGVSMILAGSLTLCPRPARMWLSIALIGLAAGRQALWAEDYRHDWDTHRALFWQLFWRAPGLVPNTTLLINEGALPYYADNSLIGSLNWIYDPDNRSPALDYVLFYPTSRQGGTLSSLEPGQSVSYDFIAEVFSGSTSQVAAFYFQPPGCLRLLDSEIDPVNKLIPDNSMMRDAARLSSDAWILTGDGARMPGIFGPEPAHGWCYYFEKAGLAGQSGSWKEVADLGDQALRLDDHPNDPLERFVFIEGYARTAQWERAVELSHASFRVSRLIVGPLLCRLWQRIELETGATPERARALEEVTSIFACTRE